MNNIPSYSTKEADIVNFSEHSKRLASALVKGGLLTAEYANKILRFQEKSRNDGEIIHFGEVIINNQLVDSGKFLDLISTKNIRLQPMELFMAYGVITRETRVIARQIQKEYQEKGIFKEMSDVCMEDLDQSIRERCKKVLSTVDKSHGIDTFDQITVTAAIEKFPRIVEKLCKVWGTPGLDPYIDELCLIETKGDRAGREGFPPDVMSELITIQLVHHRAYPQKNKTIWDEAHKIGPR